MDTRPKFSIVIPTYQMNGGIEFLRHSFEMLGKQTFKDFEVVITDDSNNDLVKDFCAKYFTLPIRYTRNPIARGMGGNTNTGIHNAKGELIKILYQDDYLAHEDSLQVIADNFLDNDKWLVTGCTHTDGRPHLPRYNDQIHRGINTIGSPSVMTIRNTDPMFFDTNLGWVLDCDYYKRMYMRFGLPKIVNDINVGIGIGDHQTTNKLSEEFKKKEIQFLIEKYS